MSYTDVMMLILRPPGHRRLVTDEDEQCVQGYMAGLFFPATRLRVSWCSY